MRKPSSDAHFGGSFFDQAEFHRLQAMMSSSARLLRSSVLPASQSCSAALNTLAETSKSAVSSSREIVETKQEWIGNEDQFSVRNFVGITGGAYILSDKKDQKFVLKPADEESYDIQKSGTVEKKIPKRNGIQYGFTAIKEQAAFLLDHNRFAGVPATALVKAQKIGTHKASPVISLKPHRTPSPIPARVAYLESPGLTELPPLHCPNPHISHIQGAQLTESPPDTPQGSQTPTHQPYIKIPSSKELSRPGFQRNISQFSEGEILGKIRRRREVLDSLLRTRENTSLPEEDAARLRLACVHRMEIQRLVRLLKHTSLPDSKHIQPSTSSQKSDMSPSLFDRSDIRVLSSERVPSDRSDPPVLSSVPSTVSSEIVSVGTTSVGSQFSTKSDSRPLSSVTVSSLSSYEEKEKKASASFSFIPRGPNQILPTSSGSMVAAALDQHAKAKSALEVASLQKFVPNLGSADDFGSSMFDIENVHRIGILDVRLFNMDRHLGNLLVVEEAEAPMVNLGDSPKTTPGTTSNLADKLGSPKFGSPKSFPGALPHPSERKKMRLVPIDHSYTLPDFRQLSDAQFEWLGWRQARKPFSKETLKYIFSLDPYFDASVLRRLGIPEEESMTVVITTLFLQKCAEAGLTLADIGEMVQRPGMGESPSVLEQVVSQAMREYGERTGLPKTDEILRDQGIVRTRSLRHLLGHSKNKYKVPPGSVRVKSKAGRKLKPESTSRMPTSQMPTSQMPTSHAPSRRQMASTLNSRKPSYHKRSRKASLVSPSISLSESSKTENFRIHNEWDLRWSRPARLFLESVASIIDRTIQEHETHLS